jgi:Holliday junction DNA helicase RuvA
MISFVKGKIISKTSSEVILETQGIGYGINITLITSEKIGNIGDTAELHTIFVFIQEQPFLYGFSDLTEREAFKLLVSVPNVGNKTALSILSSLSPSELRNSIITGNLYILQKLPGIGKKTAERMLVELKDKMLKFNIEDVSDSGLTNDLQTIKQETIAALISLGYSRLIAEKAVAKVISDNGDSTITIENLIKKSLSYVLKS